MGRFGEGLRTGCFCYSKIHECKTPLNNPSLPIDNVYGSITQSPRSVFTVLVVSINSGFHSFLLPINSFNAALVVIRLDGSYKRRGHRGFSDMRSNRTVRHDVYLRVIFEDLQYQY